MTIAHHSTYIIIWHDGSFNAERQSLHSAWHILCNRPPPETNFLFSLVPPVCCNLAENRDLIPSQFVFEWWQLHYAILVFPSLCLQEVLPFRWPDWLTWAGLVFFPLMWRGASLAGNARMASALRGNENPPEVTLDNIEKVSMSGSGEVEDPVSPVSNLSLLSVIYHSSV